MSISCIRAGYTKGGMAPRAMKGDERGRLGGGERERRRKEKPEVEAADSCRD